MSTPHNTLSSTRSVVSRFSGLRGSFQVFSSRSWLMVVISSISHGLRNPLGSSPAQLRGVDKLF